MACFAADVMLKRADCTALALRLAPDGSSPNGDLTHCSTRIFGHCSLGKATLSDALLWLSAALLETVRAALCTDERPRTGHLRRIVTITVLAIYTVYCVDVLVRRDGRRRWIFRRKSRPDLLVQLLQILVDRRARALSRLRRRHSPSNHRLRAGQALVGGYRYAVILLVVWSRWALLYVEMSGKAGRPAGEVTVRDQRIIAVTSSR